jgi:hypothetical protein
MASKLTLSLNQVVIQKAKEYALKNHTSLSLLVENYFRFLTKHSTNKSTLSPIVEELSGVIKLPENIDIKEEYTDFLIEKYK